MEDASPSKQFNSLRALLYSSDPSKCKNTSNDGSRSLASNPEHHEVYNIELQAPDPRNVRHTSTPIWHTAAEAPRGARDDGYGRTVAIQVDEENDFKQRFSSLPRALAVASKIQAEYAKANGVFRKGFCTNDSIPLEQRAAINRWHPKHGRPSPNGTTKDGTSFRLLGCCFLKILEDWELLKRIDSVRVSGFVPRAAHDTTKFHRVYWKDFQTICGQPFGKLTRAQQTTALRTFLRQKFSTDPFGKTMVPPEGSTPKLLSWAGFWLTEAEVGQITEAVLVAYEIQRTRGQNL